MIEGQVVQKYTSDLDLDDEYKAQLAEFQHIVPIGNKELRLTISSTSDIKIKPSIIWNIMKDLIGKDMSKF